MPIFCCCCPFNMIYDYFNNYAVITLNKKRRNLFVILASVRLTNNVAGKGKGRKHTNNV